MRSRLRIMAIFCSLFLPPAVSLAQCTTNVALGMSASATSHNGNSYAGYATDGNLSSRWESQHSDPQQITIDLGIQYNLCKAVIRWEAASARNFTVEVSSDHSNWITVGSVTNNTVLVNTFSFMQTARWIRMSGTSRTTTYGYSIYEFEAYGVPAYTCSGINLSQGKTGYASSSVSGNLVSNAFDNNNGTRWESASSDPQYLYVDLGGLYDICQVQLKWEAAFARNYTIDFSADASAWNTVYSFTENVSVNNTIPLMGTARYVRVYGTARATGYGYSLYELGVLGNNNALPLLFTAFKAARLPDGVHLQWQVRPGNAGESFIVERKNSGSSVFQTVAVVPVMQTQDNGQYQWTDPEIAAGTVYYRIHFMRKDGTGAYSAVIPVKTIPAEDKIYCEYDRSADRILLRSKDNIPITGVHLFTSDGVPAQYEESGGMTSKKISMKNSYRGLLIVQFRYNGQLMARKVVRY